MEKTPHNDFFTDNQTAVVLGLTLRSLQNKIHREKLAKVTALPPHHMASARGRLWEKTALKAFLEDLFDDAKFVAERMDRGNQAPALGKLGASDETLKIPATAPWRKKKPTNTHGQGAKKVGRPRIGLASIGS